MLPHWKRTDISDPYYVDLTVTTFADNIFHYGKNALFPNFQPTLLIFIAILYAVFFIPQTIKKMLLKKLALIDFLIIVAIFGLLYVPFAFLKYQRYANYVSLALIPWYIIILYPLFSDFSIQRVSPYFKKLIIALSLVILTFSFLPNKTDLFWYFKYSPKLHIKSIWDQMQSVLPNIPDGTKRVIFIDGEEFPHKTNVTSWSIPPFWWHVGHGTMFAIIYGKLIAFEVVKEKPAIEEPGNIYIMVDKGPIYYSLSLYK